MEAEVKKRLDALKKIIQTEITSYEEFQIKKETLLQSINAIEEMITLSKENQDTISQIKLKEDDNTNVNVNSLKNTLNFNYEEDEPIQNNNASQSQHMIEEIPIDHDRRKRNHSIEEIDEENENLQHIVSTINDNKKYQSINEPNERIMTNTQISNHSKNRQKASRVADILMKINSNEIVYDIISKVFSKKIYDDLISTEVSMELIESVEKTIEEIELLELEESKNYEKSQPNILLNTNYFPRTSNNTSSLRLNKSKKKKLSNIDTEFMMRYPKTYKTITGSSNPYINRNKSTKYNGKPFVSYTSPASRYFDPSLQNGGQSKLSNRKRSKSKYRNDVISPVKRYIESHRNYTIAYEPYYK